MYLPALILIPKYFRQFDGPDWSNAHHMTFYIKQDASSSDIVHSFLTEAATVYKHIVHTLEVCMTK